jgi:hypothetical protein
MKLVPYIIHFGTDPKSMLHEAAPFWVYFILKGWFNAYSRQLFKSLNLRGNGCRHDPSMDLIRKKGEN